MGFGKRWEREHAIAAAERPPVPFDGRSEWCSRSGMQGGGTPNVGERHPVLRGRVPESGTASILPQPNFLLLSGSPLSISSCMSLSLTSSSGLKRL